VGEDLIAFAIQVFGWFIYIRTDGNDGSTMFYLFDTAFSFHRCYKISHIPGNIRDDGVMRYMYQRVLINRAYHAI